MRDAHLLQVSLMSPTDVADPSNMHRPYTGAQKPGNNSDPAGPNGDHMCDTPVSLEKSMYKAIKDMFPDQAFSMFTGDIVDHALFNTSKPYNQDESKSVR